MGLDYYKPFINYCSFTNCWLCFIPVKQQLVFFSFFFFAYINHTLRRAKFEAELKAMQWLIKWEDLTTRTLLHNGVATPSFNKLSSSIKVINI